MRLRIFVIDDEEGIRDTFRWYFEDLGHEVLTVSEPHSCQVYQGHDCQNDHSCGDLLFVDYTMPRMNGLEFVEHMVRRGCKGMTNNMFIMSGNIDVIDRQKAAKLGCRILEKPVSFKTLDKIVADIETEISPTRKLAAL